MKIPNSTLFQTPKKLLFRPPKPYFKTLEIPYFNPPKNIFQTPRKLYFRPQNALFQIAKNLHEDGKETPLFQDLQQTTTRILTELKLNVFQQKRKKIDIMEETKK